MVGDEKTSAYVSIRLDETTGLHYVIGKETVLFENGVRIARSSFDTRLRDNKTTTDLILEARKDPANCNWDFKNACKTTNLTRLKHPIQPVKPTTETKVTEEKTVRAITEPKKDTVKEAALRVKGFFSAPHSDILAIATVVGIACACMSMYHAFVFLHDVNGKPSPVAFVTAFTMVLFAASAFTIARHLGSDRKIGFFSRLIFPPIFVCLGLGVIWFLVFSTITVNFEQFKARDTAKEAAFIENDTSVKTTNAALDTKDQEIANANADVARLTKQSDDWYAEYMHPLPNEKQSEDPAEQKKIDARLAVAVNKRNVAYKNYTDSQKQLQSATDKRDALMRDKGALVTKTDVAVSTAKDKRETVYTVVSAKTGISETTLQFLVYVIPPTFFDVVSPVTLSVVLLLRDRRKDKSEETRSGTAIDSLIAWLKKRKKEA